MNRPELLTVGKQMADRWYQKNYVRIKTRQNVERMKKRLTRREA